MRPRAATELPTVEGVLAGAAEADITPPPGMPKAGYSANAHDGHGFRTRLRARVTHLRAGRSSIALVQLDLLAGSSVLQYLVADAIADRTDIPLAGVWLGATHTHAGPGQFLGTDFYNQHASNRPGFDPAYTDFLVRQIAGAVIEAHDTRAPAKVAVGRTEVWGVTRNRSQDPHVQNRTVRDKRLDPQRKWVSINPDLHLLRVDRIVEGVPFARTIYGATQTLIRSLGGDGTPTGNRVVLIEFPSENMRCVGIVTRVFPASEEQPELAAVYVPTTPNPTSGFVEIVPTSRLTWLDWTKNDAMAFIVSGGAMAPDNVPINWPDGSRPIVIPSDQPVSSARSQAPRKVPSRTE